MVGTLAATFLDLANTLAGPLATAINAISKGFAFVFGESAAGGAAVASSAEKYKGFGRSSGAAEAKENSVVSGLQRIGGGGGFGGGDPVLSESRTQTRLLQRIADSVARSPGGSRDPVPV